MTALYQEALTSVHIYARDNGAVCQPKFMEVMMVVVWGRLLFDIPLVIFFLSSFSMSCLGDEVFDMVVNFFLWGLTARLVRGGVRGRLLLTYIW